MGISIMGGTQSYTNSYSTSAITGQKPPKKPEIDTDGSGTISKNELSTFIDDIKSKSGQDIDAEEIFSKVDSDGDGEISTEEEKSLKDALPKPQGMPNMSGSSGPPPMPPMSMADTNGDNSIDKDELSTLLSDVSEKTGTDLDSTKIFEKLDTNKDGTVSAEEAESLKEYLPEPAKMKAQMESQLQAAYASGTQDTSSYIGSTLNYTS